MPHETAEIGRFRRYWLQWVAGVAVACAILGAWYLLDRQEPGNADWIAGAAPALVFAVLFAAVLLVGWIVYTNRKIRRQAAALKLSERRLASVLENLPGIAFRCDYAPNWAAEFFSAGCENLSGYPRQDFETQRVFWGDLIAPDDRERLWREIQDSNGAFESEYRIATRDGEQKWMWTRGKVRTSEPSGERWLEGVIVEVTEEKEAAEAHLAAQREASDLRESLAQVDRLTLLGEMAAGIAHEINQPLSAISMYAQSGIRFLRQEPIKTDKLNMALEKLSQQTHRAAEIIQQMRWLGGQSQARFVEVDCNPLIAEVALLASSEAHLRGIEIDIDLCPEVCVCHCVPIQIQQVALNLLRNAMASMTAIECRNGYHIYLSTRCTDSQFMVSVADMGTHIGDDMAPTLFKPFSSSEETTSLGLGLSMCNGIIAAHHGDVDFVNNNMGGVTFCFSIPRVEMEHS